ncbi:hypothetical protein [Prauserella cavernicola]|uniref:Uncharacterized protein n=1 Tax=Prauserella cavernicola TaxID=2800127 RepID=A0A934QPH3_9PSEU|nr:hypothetical protein [Prauserella cavernicola]MBK1783767.1 hypothetical protein [Prauserella cavernicola]
MTKHDEHGDHDERRTARPEPTVVEWLHRGLLWDGEQATHELYEEYLAFVGRLGAAPVTRRRFVDNLADLGVREIRNPGGSSFLVRD